MNTLNTLNKLVNVAYNNTPATVAKAAGLSEHLVSKAEGYTDLLRFMAVLDKNNTVQVAEWLDTLPDDVGTL